MELLTVTTKIKTEITEKVILFGKTRNALSLFFLAPDTTPPGGKTTRMLVVLL